MIISEPSNNESEISNKNEFEINFERAVQLLDAEERYASSVDDVERKSLEQTIRRLNQKITPAAKKATLKTRNDICVSWETWLAEGNPANVSKFFQSISDSRTKSNAI